MATNGCDGPQPAKYRRVGRDGRCDDPKADFDTPFRLGDYVVDKETLVNVDMGKSYRPSDDTNVAIVVREGRELACDACLADGRTVADVNHRYGETEPVVDVVFVDALDKRAGEWRENWERWTLDWRLDDFKKERDVPIRTYAYPTARLLHADDDRLHGLDLDDLPPTDPKADERPDLSDVATEDGGPDDDA